MRKTKPRGLMLIGELEKLDDDVKIFNGQFDKTKTVKINDPKGRGFKF